MAFDRQYDYAFIRQRHYINFLAACAALTTGTVFGQLVDLLVLFFPYRPIFHLVFVSFLVLHLLGLLLGRSLFSSLRHGYIMFRIISIAFFLLTGGVVVLSQNLIQPDLFNPFHVKTMIISACYVITPLLLGTMNAYTVKVACGKFLDEKKGTVVYTGSIITGFMLGIEASQFESVLLYGIPFITFAGLVFSSIIKTDYSPESFTARDYSDHSGHQEAENTDQFRDDLFFTYLNFSFIALYTHLIILTISRNFGSHSGLLLQTLVIFMAGLIAGYVFSRFLRRKFWHVYSELTFPFLFLFFLITMSFPDSYIIHQYALLAILPLAFVMGTSLYHACYCISVRFDQERASRILRMALFVIPVPIITAISFIPLSETLFFVVFYALALLNIVLPGLYISQRSVRTLRKGMYAIFAIVIIPFFILVHLYFRFPTGSSLYVRQTEGLSDLSKTDFSAHFISPREDVMYFGKTILQVSDASLKNMERAFSAATLYAPDKGSRLVIDGYRSFFRNNMYSLLDNVHSVDYIPVSSLDNISPPVSGEKKVIQHEKDLTLFFALQKLRYSFILDVPNCYDIQASNLRFSLLYYSAITTRLDSDGVFAQVINISVASPDKISEALQSFEASFSNRICYFFSNHLLLVGTNSSSSLVLKTEMFDRYQSSMINENHSEYIVFDPLQILAHYIPWSEVSASFSPKSVEEQPVNSLDCIRNSSLQSNTRFVETLQLDQIYPWNEKIISFLDNNNDPLSILKQAYNADTAGNFEDETKLLFSLQKFAEYNPQLRLYLQRLFSYKEKTYFAAARHYEQTRNWDQAETLYRAITNINPSNFDATYRLGIMLITLQKLDDATAFLQQANSLQANDAGVLHHMGIIAFSRGEYQQAITFFNDSLANKGNNSMTWFYIGLAYEELGNYYRAREQYQLAHQHDPNNPDILASITRVDAIINKATRQWEKVRHKNQVDEEEGIDIPLPINKTAYDVRMNNLSEEEERKFFADKAEKGDDNPINLPEGGLPDGDEPINGNP